MIRQNQMSARADLYSFGRDFQSLCTETIGLFKKCVRINDHPVTQDADLAGMDYAGRDQVQNEGAVADVD